MDDVFRGGTLLLLAWALGCSTASNAGSDAPRAEDSGPLGVTPAVNAATPSSPAPSAGTGDAPGAGAPGEGVGAVPLDETPAAGAPGQAPAEGEAEVGAGLTPEADAGPALNANATGGSGGPVGPAELVSTGGLTYEIDAPAGNSPRGLLILLHGSTASNYDTFIGLMRQVASSFDLIPVSVLAPNGQGWNEGNQVRAAELLHRLIQDDLFTKYNVDKSRVLFSGQSSGGGFLSSNFVPAHAADYTGGAFFQCGAAPPNIAFAPSPQTREQFRLHFEITTGDPIWPESYAASLQAYTAAGMQLTQDDTKPGGHCAFDQQQVILDHIDFVLGR
jgi:predicted esterase